MYQDRLLQHYRAPFGRGVITGETSFGARKNPLCGDEFRVAIAVANDTITQVGFEGRGCSIATASASMLTETVRGLAVHDARALIERVERLLQGDTLAEAAPPGDLIALAGVAAYPQRVGCARMPWQALRDALDGDGEAGSARP
jgi:nitrogen fixation NifU-like protein